MLSIGSFAMLSGLSVTALRHYDDVGVLAPAHVDSRTGYRYYRPDQVRTGRSIVALRSVELPIEDLKEILQADDDGRVREILAAHRERLHVRTQLLAEQLDRLDTYIEKGVRVPEVTGNRIVMINIAVDDAQVAKRFYEDGLGVDFFSQTHEGQIAEHYEGTFGTWPTDSFFLMQVFTDPGRAGTANFGFSCEDLEETYRRCLGAGGTDVHGPKDLPGMPRVAQVKDPSGNDIGLYQG